MGPAKSHEAPLGRTLPWAYRSRQPPREPDKIGTGRPDVSLWLGSVDPVGVCALGVHTVPGEEGIIALADF